MLAIAAVAATDDAAAVDEDREDAKGPDVAGDQSGTGYPREILV